MSKISKDPSKDLNFRVIVHSIIKTNIYIIMEMNVWVSQTLRFGGENVP